MQSRVRLFLVRHGEVDANVEYRFLGRSDDPLNATGLEQAHRLAELFTGIPIDAVWSSPLARALRTAEAIASRKGLVVATDDRLIELDFGRWEGLTRADVEELGSDQQEILTRWDQDPTRPAPGGESLAAVRDRIVGFANHLAASEPGRSITIVSHMGPIKALLCAVLELPLTGARRLFLDPATVTVVDWSQAPVIRLFNSHAHLGWTRARWLVRERLRSASS